jgi:hypothetical protein
MLERRTAFAGANRRCLRLDTGSSAALDLATLPAVIFFYQRVNIHA